MGPSGFPVSRLLLGYICFPSLPEIHLKTFLLTLNGNEELLHYSLMTRIPFDPGGEMRKILVLGRCGKGTSATSTMCEEQTVRTDV